MSHKRNYRFAAIPSGAAADPRLCRNDLRVLISLRGHANADELAYLKRASIAKETNLSPNAVSKATTRLVRFGWIVKIGRGGFSQACTYQMTIPEQFLKISSPDQTVPAEEPFPPENGSLPRTVPPEEPNGATDGTATVPSQEPNGAAQRTRKEQTKNRTKNRPLTEGGCDTATAFEQFWAVWPKKVAKEAARQAWEALPPDLDLQQRIIKAVKTQATTAAWQREEGRYIPHPAKWLREQRWEDLTDATANGQGVKLRQFGIKGGIV
jgi:hypothetical protein